MPSTSVAEIQKLLPLIWPTLAFVHVGGFKARVPVQLINVGAEDIYKGMYEANVGGNEDYSELLPSVNSQTSLFPR